MGDLPVLYLLLGVTMFIATLGVSALLGRLGRGRVFLVIPASIALVIAVMVLGLPKSQHKAALSYGLIGAFIFRFAATLPLPFAPVGHVRESLAA